ncbi:MAG TPA: hypothetical protein VGK00_11930 [Anaerolineales bacterium]
METPTKNFERKYQIPILLAGLALAVVCLYVLVARVYFRAGFPLDDAWIHQSYARSLAQTGRWEFIPGQPSAGGSTSPLWTALLALGRLVGFNFYAWTYLLGAVFLWATACLAEMTVRHKLSAYNPKIPWVGILFTLEWHLAWAAASGMETILQIFLVMLFFSLLFSFPQRTYLLGLVVGLGMWVRPDSLTLLGPLLLVGSFGVRSWRGWFKDILRVVTGFALPAALYLLFNLAVAGSLMPNTFYAKQTEYADLLLTPLYRRFFEQSLQPLTGVGLLLLPLVLIHAWQAVIKRDWSFLAAVAWLLGYLALYALRLPVTYQHGRYAMPVIPLLLFLGSLGAAQWLASQAGKFISLRLAWKVSTGLLLVIFLGIGAWSFARDVAFIENDMVAPAQWVAANLPPQALVAAHDIGALGYFGAHHLVDLAGLISPEVIPFMRDQAGLARFLDEQQVSYLVTFPGWYPELVRGKTVVFSAQPGLNQGYGSEHMHIYRWR